MTRARVLTEALGGSALSRAAQARALPAPIQPWWPADIAEWTTHVARVRASADAGWLDALRPALAADGHAAERLERAARDGIVVTTGQQAGLFGGPVYTLSKALSAIAIADALQERLSLPVAPVFWAATDDADWIEASSIHVADADGVTQLSLEHGPSAGTTMSHAPLGDTTELLRRLHRACGSSAHGHFFELARAAFAAPQSLGAAYVQLVRGLLQPLGMAVLDASHPVVRAAALPLMRRALERAGVVQEAVAERTRSIRGAGFEPQVEDDRGLSLVFTVKHGVKRRLSVDEAPGETAGAESAFAPNVLLRPVVERALFPTVCYVAGPGEIAYFTQASAVAHALDAASPVAVPRWSGTIVEPFTQRALTRLGIEPADAGDMHALEARFARAAMPSQVADAWRRLQQRLGDALGELETAVRESSLVPPPVIEGMRRSLGHRMERTERRLLAAAKRRDEQVRRDLALVSATLFPLGQRQERVLSFIPMLARNGDDLLRDMRAAASAHAAGLMPASRGQPVPAR